MAETPDSETRERLRALCSQITVAEELDPEIQEELLTHMEDKLSAYLHGSEPVTEEDAYLLVREHFGDPGVVKALFQRTHVEKADLGLGRRLAAITVVSLACYAGLRILVTFNFSLFVWAASRYAPESMFWPCTWTALNMILACSLAPVFWVIVRRWRRQIDRGYRPWFLRMSPRRLVYTVSAVALASYAIPTMATSVGGFGIPQSAILATMIATLGMGAVTIAMVAQSTAWLWWCDRPPRTKRALSYATLTWALVGACGSMPVTLINITTDQPTGGLTLFKLAGADSEIWWSLGTIHPTGMLQMALLSFLAFVVLGYVGRMSYWAARKIEKRIGESARNV